MLNLNFDYVSDIHLDFWLKCKMNKVEKLKLEIYDFIQNILPKCRNDILIVAGDISNSNFISKMFFDLISIEYKYVLFVFGNHDLYLDSKSQANKYKKNSFNRLNELVDYIESHFSNVYFLDGNIIEINGIKFGGCGLWYDLSYNNDLFSNDNYNEFYYFKNRSNDYSCIFGINYMDIYNKELLKINNIIDSVDVMISHIVPLGSLLNDVSYKEFISNDGTNILYNSFKDKIMYVFNNKEVIEKFKGKVWVYGHSHDVSKDLINGIYFIRNCIGYPVDNSKILTNGIKQFKFKKKSLIF